MGEPQLDDVSTAAGSPSPTEHLLKIGEVAERIGLSLRTIRFYEEDGLVVPETRTRAASASTPAQRSTGSR